MTCIRVVAYTALLSAILSVPALALPPSAQLDDWKGPNNNCYNYALDERDDDFKQPGVNTDWPNGGAFLTGAQWCEKATNRAVADGLRKLNWNPGDPIPTAPGDSNLVALATFGGRKGTRFLAGDFHWYRLNGDGTWSQKHGSDPATDKYVDGSNVEHPFTDPRDVNQREGYDHFCGFFLVAKSLDVPTDTLGLKSGVLTPDALHWYEMVKSGDRDPKQKIVNEGISQAADRLPTITPSNQVPDPLWHYTSAGEPRGFMLIPGDLVPGFPPRLRVWNGVVAVYSDPEGTNITYYNDDQGLESFLVSRAYSAPGASWPALTMVALALLASGSLIVLRRRASAS